MTVSPLLDSRAASLPNWALLMAAVSCLPVAFYAPKAETPLFVTVASAMLWEAIARRAPVPTPGLASGSASAFVIVALISVSWSPNPGAAVWTLCMFAATLAGAGTILYVCSRLDVDRVRQIARWITAGGLIGFALLMIELASGGLIVRTIGVLRGKTAAEHMTLTLKPGLAVAALFIWPWGLALVRVFGTPIACALIVVALALFLLLGSDTAAFGLVCGAVLASAMASSRRWAAPACTVLVAVVILAHPWLANRLPDPTQPGSRLEALSNSADHRIYIWRNTAAEIAKAPLLGRGFDSTRELFGPKDVHSVSMLPDIPSRAYEVRTEPIPLHPHNLTLQIWLETGLSGTVLWALFMVGLVRLADRRWPAGIQRFAAFGLIGTAFSIAHIGFGAWQSWWLAALSLSAGFAAATLSHDEATG